MPAQNPAHERLPLVVFEDTHLLVINKPAGLNTHAPSPFAGEGVYEWLRDRESRWGSLAIIHRLDKDTSGLLVFGKTPEANRSLTEQFTRRVVRKTYVLLTDRAVSRTEFTASSALVRSGDKYLSRPLHAGADRAETRFRRVSSEGRLTTVAAEPVTGRTHQIRVHAAEHGFPVLGDTLYGGSLAPRVCLHAEALSFQHPVTRQEITFQASVALPIRDALINHELTEAYRIVHGSSDGWPGWYVERLGDYLLSQSERALEVEQMEFLRGLMKGGGVEPSSAAAAGGPFQAAPRRVAAPLQGAYHKLMRRGGGGGAESSPQLVLGEAASERILVRENGVLFELSFQEGYSVGLFLDQRDNRRRLLTNQVAAGFGLLPSGAPARVLNTFAYTCGFSVCAAQAGAVTTSLDLSRKYLEWGKRNFIANGLEPAGHEFLHGEVFDWLGRLSKKRRRFGLILLDPPTFSRSKEGGVFRVEKDFGRLVKAALPLLEPGGVLFASSNAATWEPEKFLASISDAISSAGRRIGRHHYAPQPPDFPISRADPGYLKTVWIRVE